MSEYPSTVVMPVTDTPCPSVLDFLTRRFPGIGREIWEARLHAGKILTEKGVPLDRDRPCTPLKKLYYFREVAEEPSIPFAEKILFCNDDLLVACKPHFLPVIPAGPYVNECLLHRLREKTGNKNLSPINRIDRETAGLVLFSMNRATRGRYQVLFMQGAVKKTYEAVTHAPFAPPNQSWTMENRIIKGDPWFRMKTAPGIPNAVSDITLKGSMGNTALFHLHPVTGKKHQLRIHLSTSGFPILNDRYYPDLLPEEKRDFSAPLQLLARRLQFCDPLSARTVTYESERQLQTWPPGAQG